jgi:hypothetical protein
VRVGTSDSKAALAKYLSYLLKTFSILSVGALRVWRPQLNTEDCTRTIRCLVFFLPKRLSTIIAVANKTPALTRTAIWLSVCARDRTCRSARKWANTQHTKQTVNSMQALSRFLTFGFFCGRKNNVFFFQIFVWCSHTRIYSLSYHRPTAVDTK